MRSALKAAMLLGSAASAAAFIILHLTGTGRLQLSMVLYLYSGVALAAAALGHRQAQLQQPGGVSTTIRDLIPLSRLSTYLQPSFIASIQGRRVRASEVRIGEETVSLRVEDGRRSYGITYPRDDLVFLRPADVAD